MVAFGVGVGVAGAADGDLDPSFGNGGQANSDPTTFNEEARSAVLDSQGRIVTAFTGFPKEGGGGPNRAFVARYLPNGELDTSFGGGGGVVEIPWTIAKEAESAEAVAIDGQGRIVVGGSAVKGNVRGFDFAAARLLPNGTLDPSFGEGGVATLDIPEAGFDVGDAVAVDSLGRVMVGGQAIKTGTPSVGAMTVVRWTEAGVPDPSFGKNGVAKVNVVGSTSGSARTLAVDGAGRIVVGGSVSAGGNFNSTVARLLGGGSLDPSFGSGGIVSLSFRPGVSSSIASLAMAGSDIVAVGNFEEESIESFGVTRLLSNGAPDPGFADAGMTTRTLPGSDLSASAVTVDPAGRIVIGGRVSEPLVTNAALFRYTANGTPDPAFGSGGIVRATFNAAFSFGVTAMVDGAGRYVLFGRASSGVANLLGFARFVGTTPTASPGPGPTEPRAPAPPPPAAPPKPKCAGLTATVVGTAGADRLTGTKKVDVIVGLGGNDTINGLAGNDLVCAGAGADKVVGGAGNDRVLGEGGNDKIFGGPGADKLLGGGGADTLVGGPGKDKENGGPGKDRQR